MWNENFRRSESLFTSRNDFSEEIFIGRVALDNSGTKRSPQLAGQKLEAGFTAATVEILSDGKCVASRARSRAADQKLALQLHQRDVPLQRVQRAVHLGCHFNRNARGVYFTGQKALPLLAGKASIILSGSAAWQMGASGFGAYAAMKAAVDLFCPDLDRGVGQPRHSSERNQAWTDGDAHGPSRR